MIQKIVTMCIDILYTTSNHRPLAAKPTPLDLLGQPMAKE